MITAAVLLWSFQSAKDTSLFSNPLKGIFSGVKTQAQNMPEWVPDYTSVSFFDTDEVGAWVYSDWQTPGGQTASGLGVTHGNGSMFVAHRGTNNRVYVGKWDSNGNSFRGWGEVPAAETPDSVAIEYYWGRVYLAIRGGNNVMYYTYSDNEGGSWQPWRPLPGSTPDAPELEKLGNKLYIAHRDHNGHPYLADMTNGSNSWSSWVQKGTRQTDEKITLAANGTTRLYMGLNERYTGQAIVNLDAINYNSNNWRTVRGYTKGSFGIVGINNKVCFQLREISDELLQGCTDPGIVNQPEFIRSYLTSRVDPVIDKDWNLMQVATGPSNEIKVRKLGFNTNTRGDLMETTWQNGGSGFQENNALEPKISLANGESTNQRTYLSKNTSPAFLCEPLVKYAVSNLPEYYLDTRARFVSFGSSSNCDSDTVEVFYTLGSAYPKQIDANKIYYSYWVDSKGDLSYPRFSYRVQIGENRPDNCWSESWCRSSISPDSHYECNSKDSDTFCVWQARCQVTCNGRFITPESAPGSKGYFVNLTDRSTTYPYYKWIYTK